MNVMNCQQARHVLENDFSALTEVRVLPELGIHFQECELCRQWYAELLLQSGLSAEPVAEPHEGFVDNLIATAIKRSERSHNVRLSLAAAVAMIAVAAGLLLNAAMHRDIRVPYEITLAPNLEKIVEVIIDSDVDRESANITIELASNVQLRGFPDKQVVAWETQLREGKNLLRLPVILTNQQDGRFEVGLNYGETKKGITVIVLAERKASEING